MIPRLIVITFGNRFLRCMYCLYTAAASTFDCEATGANLPVALGHKQICLLLMHVYYILPVVFRLHCRAKLSLNQAVLCLVNSLQLVKEGQNILLDLPVKRW